MTETVEVVLSCGLSVEHDENVEDDLDNKLDDIMKKIEKAFPGITVDVEYVEE